MSNYTPTTPAVDACDLSKGPSGCGQPAPARHHEHSSSAAEAKKPHAHGPKCRHSHPKPAVSKWQNWLGVGLAATATVAVVSFLNGKSSEETKER